MNQSTIIVLLFLALSSLSASPQYMFLSEKKETDFQSWEIYDFDSSSIAYPNSSEEPTRLIGKTETVQSSSQSSPIHWYRSQLFFPEPLMPTEVVTISIPALLDAYELYWDGKIVGTNGSVEASKKHRVGTSGRYFHLTANQLTTGLHTVALRVVNNQIKTGSLTHPITIGRSEQLRQTHLTRFGTSIFLAGIFTVTALFHLFMIDNKKRRNSHVLFSLFSLSCGGHLAVNILIHFGSIPLSSIQYIAIAGDIFWFGMIALLPIFLFIHFSAYGRNVLIPIITTLSATIVTLPRLSLYNIIPINLLPALHNLNLIYAYISVVVAIGIVFGATIRKRKGSRTILLGMIVFFMGLIITTLFNIENGWSVGFAFLNVFITIALSRQFSDERKQYYKSELRASRLELELLKGHMQPHFLLNSLNSIVAWIEEEPAVAAKLVNALSQELRLLMAYAGERKINLSQEIKMCKIHLEVMNMRQEKKYTMLVEGEREGIEIPPFILHTVIENGISHGFRKKDEGIFRLSVLREASKIVLKLHNNGDNRTRTATAEGKGTGLRYIRSRLLELYGTNFSFVTGSVSDGWETTITIPGGSA